MNLRIGGPGTPHRPRLLCAAPAAGLRKETANVIVRLSPIAFLSPRHFGPALTGVRVWAVRLTRAGTLRYRRRGAILRTLRPVVVRNTPGCWRGTPGKANVSLPFAVVVFVCHLYRLVSCITRPSYKKDVQQMRTYAKTSVSGMDGSEPGAIKRHPPRVIDRVIKVNAGIEWRPLPFVPKTAPLVLQFCLRSSYKRRCCAKAVS